MYEFASIEIDINVNLQKYFNQLKKGCHSINILHCEEVNDIKQYTIVASKDDISEEFYLIVSGDKVKYLGQKKQNLMRKVIPTQNNLFVSRNLINISERLFLHNNKKIESILDIIVCSSDKCPICGAEMNSIHDPSAKSIIKICSNKCYCITNSKTKKLNIFTEFFAHGNERKVIKIEKFNTINDKVQILHDILQTINYWKENERYLIHILGGK